MMCSFLITGASGFVGLSLCGGLRVQFSDVNIRALNRSVSQGPWDRVWLADISVDDALPANAFAGVDTVFHLASKAHAVTEVAGEEDEYAPVIVDGTRRVLEAALAAGVRRFVYVSSVKAMGEGNGPGSPLRCLTEADAVAPDSPYGMAKAAAEQLVLQSTIPHVAVLRPVMVYGPGQKGNLTRMEQAIRNKRFPPLPETGNRRSVIHVDDLVSAIIQAASHPAANRQTFIVAEDQAWSTRQMYDILCKKINQPPPNWTIPLSTLKLAAKAGDLFFKLTKKRPPIDKTTLNKLLGSAWYGNGKIKTKLEWKPLKSLDSSF